MSRIKSILKKIKEDAPTNVTGASIAGTTPDTVGVNMKTRNVIMTGFFKRKKKL